MTRDVAIAILKEMKPIQHRADGKSTTHILQTMALEMAIRKLEQEPCLDCISREVAIEAINYVVIKFPGLITNKQQETVIETINLTKDAFKNALIKLPSVKPEMEAGFWQRQSMYAFDELFITRMGCSKCGYEMGSRAWKYCPNCGSKMEVEG